MIPHPDKVAKGGEDAFYHDERVLAVADGVGGWASQGVDPGIYSQQLCDNVGDYSKRDWKKYAKNPKALITDAWKQVKVLGSSTLVVLTLPEQGDRLYASFIGDSSYVILRQHEGEYQLLHASEVQQKGFNFPYQLGWNGNGDTPDKSLSFDHEVKSGDIVVAGSDGVFDNLDPLDVTGIVQDFLKVNNFNANDLASEIADKAFVKSLDTSYFSPFAREAKEAGYNFAGGKSDDITVVVGQVVLSNMDQDL